MQRNISNQKNAMRSGANTSGINPKILKILQHKTNFQTTRRPYVNISSRMNDPNNTPLKIGKT